MTTVHSSPQTVEFSGVGGIKLVADEWNRGASDRPTILMLHGGGQNRFSWKNTGQILADDGFHVVALDTRGHGDSDRAPNADYDVETLTADVMPVRVTPGAMALTRIPVPPSSRAAARVRPCTPCLAAT